MSEAKKHMTPIERRMKARRIRFWERKQETREQAAARFKVSRVYAYTLMEELDVWEATATYQSQADEIRTAPKCQKYHVYLWFLCSGNMLLAYIRGEISATLFNGLEYQTNEFINAELQTSLLD